MIDLDKFNTYFGPNSSIRKATLKKIEEMREAKTISKSIECGVSILWCGPDESGAFWDSETAKTALNVSWVEMRYAVSPTYDVVVYVWDLKGDSEFVQCPRCNKFHKQKSNYDLLCDNCMRVMLTNYPNHHTLNQYFADRKYLVR